MNKSLTNLIAAAVLCAPAVAWGAESIPYTADFNSEDGLAQWTSKAGPATEVTDGWKLNYNNEYIKFDFTDGVAEDNYLISPAIEFSEVGDYKMKLTCMVNGKMEVLLGTDIDDLSSFSTAIHTFDQTDYWSDPYEVSFSIEEAEVYYLAFHLCAEEGSSMGYRLNSMSVMVDKAVPALVDDLKVVADDNDELKVELSWTNPAKATTGADLETITKIEVLRDGQVVETLTDELTPGAAMTYTDEPETAGIYTYSVLVYDANGASGDELMEVESGYVGRPTASFPYTMDFDAEKMFFTCLDADNDGSNWVAETPSWSWQSGAFVSTNDNGNADNYLASPYIHLTPGYYKLTSTVEARGNSFEVGVATDRHKLVETFVKTKEYKDVELYSAQTYSTLIVIDKEGDYCIVWHHVGESASGYRSVKLTGVELDSQVVLPSTVTDFAVIPTMGQKDVELVWTNPSVDNGGRDLTSLTKIEILCDDELLETITKDVTPGKDMSYRHTVDESGEYTFAVKAYNENGCAEEDAPSVKVFVGTGKDMPYTVDFTEWDVIDGGDAWDVWKVDQSTGAAYYEGYSETDDAIHSPYLYMTPDQTYTLTFTTFGKSSADAATFELHAGTDSKNMNLVKELSHSGMEEQQHSVVLQPKDVETLADDASEAITIPAGNVKLGFHIRQAGTVYIRDLKVVANTGTTGIEAVGVENAQVLSCVDGIVTFAEGATDVVVSDLAGRTLYHTAQAPATLNLYELATKGILLVQARSANSTATTIKVVL